MGMNGNDLFNRLVAGLSLMFGLGHPSDGLTNMLAVFIPPILAVLVALAIFFIGKILTNYKVGLVASAIYAVLPGESMGRALLGMVDTHILEVLSGCLLVLFFILAVKNENQIRRGIIWASAIGIVLWLYTWAWAGSPLFIFIICLYFVVMSIIRFAQRKPLRNLLLIGGIIFIIPTILLLLKAGFSPDRTVLMLMPIALLVLAWLYVMSRLPQKVHVVFRIIIMASPIIVLLASYYGVQPYIRSHPELLQVMAYNTIVYGQGVLNTIISIINAVGYIFRWVISMLNVFTYNLATSTQEEVPFLYLHGEFSLKPIWGNFGICILLFLVGLVYAIHKMRRDDRRVWIFVGIWTFVILMLSLAMRRFAYYLAVNVALMSGLAVWLMYRKIRIVWKQAVVAILLVAAIILPFIFPVKPFQPSYKEMSHPQFVMSDGWAEALEWLKENTAEPFGSSDYYYDAYTVPKEPDYTVLAWWDYGYWITREGRRVPISNPGGGARNLSAQFFIATNPQDAESVIRKTKARYIVIDYDTAVNKFYAMPFIAQTNKETSEYFGTYNLLKKNQIVETQQFLYVPYYESMVVRLYNFDGKQVKSPGTLVIQYENNGVIGLGDFKNIEDAQSYVQTHEGNFAIGGTDPFVSPVDLEVLEGYRLVFASSQKINGISEVKVFEGFN
jgi:dolichyl-diphosphooligosaccharide--protein glycosyltransferase